MTPEQLDTYFSAAEDINTKWPKAGVSDLADHIDYAASDFNGGGGITGWNNASETLNVTVELVKRGYSEDDIAKIWGGNLLRVMEEVEAYAARTQK